MTRKEIDALSYKIIGCAIEVHRHLGPGLLESVYEKCMMQELAINNIKYRSQVKTDISYKGIELNTELRLDLLVEDAIVLELKSVEVMHPLFTAQILSYMNILQKPKGILINFNCENIYKEGQKTLVNNHYAMLDAE